MKRALLVYATLWLSLLSFWACAAPQPQPLEEATGTALGALVESDVQAGYVHGPHATAPDELPYPLYISGGQTHVDDMGELTWHNVVMRSGYASQQDHGEASQLNFMYGDNRDPGHPEFIAAEIGFVGRWGYDPSPEGRELTPYAWRLHSGRHPTRGVPVHLLLQSEGSTEIEGTEYMQRSAVGRGALLRDAWGVFAESSPGAGDAQGGHVVRVSRRAKTTSEATAPMRLSASYVPYGQQAAADCHLRAIEVGGAREQYRFRFDWLGGDESHPAHVEHVGDVDASAPYADRANRVVVTDSSAGSVVVQVTGIEHVALSWTLYCELFLAAP